MLNRPSIRRDIVLILIGTAIGTLFGIFVAYPELLANSRENSARIEGNRSQIELLWEAHEVDHVGSNLKEGSR